MENRNIITGTGLALPIKFTTTGSAQMISGADLINQSISIILMTEKGSLFFLGDFGSQVPTLKYSQNDTILASLLETFIRESLTEWESRIRVLSVNIFLQTDLCEATIRYQIKDSSEESTYIFPFYREIADYKL